MPDDDLKIRVALLEQSMENIKEELRNISNHLTKLVWVVITAVAVGLINLLMRFGNAVPGA